MKKQGFMVIDADQIAKNIIDENQACKKELISFFGTDILNSCLNINRKALAKKAFSAKEYTQKLNQITHPYIVKEIKNLTTSYIRKDCSPIIVDAALLFESKLDQICDKTIAVLSNLNNRKTRIMKRDSLSGYEADLRLNAQKDDLFYHKADFIIYNNESKESFLRNFIAVLSKIRENLNETST